MPVIAMDLGGSKLASALISEEGDLLYFQESPREGRGGGEAAAWMGSQLELLLQKAAQEKISLQSLGIGVPGIAYAKNGKVWAPNIPGWENYPLQELLENHVRDAGIPVFIDSDRACYILGESWKGNARGCRDAIFLAVGTGIGAGILVNDQVLRGTSDIAGAIGWMGLSQPFHEKYRSCGDFEYHASGPGLVRVAKDWIADGMYPGSRLEQMVSFSPNDIFESCYLKDPLSVAVVEQAITYWGMATANLVSLFNPEKIILGGGVFGPAIRYLDAIRLEAAKWAQPISMGQVRLEGSALGQRAGIVGAARLALKQINQ